MGSTWTAPLTTVQQALRRIAPAVGRETVPEVGNRLWMQPRSDGSVGFWASDWVQEAGAFCPATVSASGVAVVPWDRWMSLCASLRGETLEVAQTGGWLTVRCGTTQGRVPVVADQPPPLFTVESPRMGRLDTGRWNALADRVAPFVASATPVQSLPVFQHVATGPAPDGRWRWMASGGYTLVIWDWPDPYPLDQPQVLPTPFVESVRGDEPLWWEVGTLWTVRASDWWRTTRLMEETFPDPSPIITSPVWRQWPGSPAWLAAWRQAVELAQRWKLKYVGVRIEDGMATVFVDAAEAGQWTQAVPVLGPDCSPVQFAVADLRPFLAVCATASDWEVAWVGSERRPLWRWSIPAWAWQGWVQGVHAESV